MRTLKIISLAIIAVMTITVCKAQSGYRGTFEASTQFCFETEQNNAVSFGIASVHGYQFNPYFFAGTEFIFGDRSLLPIFADFKANLSKSKIKPFIDFRIGAEVIDTSTKGVYLNPSIGLQYALNNLLGIYVKAGYTNQSGIKYEDGKVSNCSGITAKVGFEF